ncbi:hypothetical protein ACFY00_30255 [Kitasatospora sp. NPDC001540]|uniref:glycoside hydrolase family 78 protein n=1 Tax=Kitasatospora sp. NPDC001540 TaxID=3364014 RepID=UPI0036B68F78
MQFFFIWNDLLVALTFTNSQDLRTVQVGLLNFTGDFGATQYGPLPGADHRLVPWPAAPLASRERATVRVRLRADGEGPSAWSAPTAVEAGLPSPADWTAAPVGAGRPEDLDASPAPNPARPWPPTSTTGPRTGRSPNVTVAPVAAGRVNSGAWAPGAPDEAAELLHRTAGPDRLRARRRAPGDRRTVRRQPQG